MTNLALQLIDSEFEEDIPTSGSALFDYTEDDTDIVQMYPSRKLKIRTDEPDRSLSESNELNWVTSSWAISGEQNSSVSTYSKLIPIVLAYVSDYNSQNEHPFALDAELPKLTNPDEEKDNSFKGIYALGGKKTVYREDRVRIDLNSLPKQKPSIIFDDRYFDEE